MLTEYKALQHALQQRLKIIANTELCDSDPVEQLHQLQQVSEEIVKWHSNHKGKIPAQLNHFLTQQSLSKALNYLESENLV